LRNPSSLLGYMNRNFSPCGYSVNSDLFTAVSFSASVGGSASTPTAGFCRTSLTFSPSGSILVNWAQQDFNTPITTPNKFHLITSSCCPGYCPDLSGISSFNYAGSVTTTQTCSSGGGVGCERSCDSYPISHTLNLDLLNPNISIFPFDDDGAIVCSAQISFTMVVRMTPGGIRANANVQSDIFPITELVGSHNFVALAIPTFTTASNSIVINATWTIS
jgi:hypothetical protein